MSVDNQTVAYHEAGHAFADFTLGFKIKSVTIVPKGEAAGLASIKNTLRLRQLEYSGLTGKQLGHYHDIVVSILAGEEAQRRFRPRSIRRHQAASDYDSVANLLLRLHPEEKERYHAMIQSLLELCQRLQVLEALNKLLFKYAGSKKPQTKDFLEKKSQDLKVMAKNALSRAMEISKKVDAVIERMKPIRGKLNGAPQSKGGVCPQAWVLA